MPDDLDLSDREIQLIERMGVLKAVDDIKDMLLLVLAVRLGGSVKLIKSEIEYARKTYDLEHNVRADDQSLDVILRARLK